MTIQKRRRRNTHTYIKKNNLKKNICTHTKTNTFPVILYKQINQLSFINQISNLFQYVIKNKIQRK